MKARKIEDKVLAVLSEAETDGNELKLVHALDRKLYTDTNKVLEALGGKWNRKAKAHVFSGPAADLVDAVILSGEVELPADFGLFVTPQAVAEVVVQAAELQPGQDVLEPSAGHGNLVMEILAAEPTSKVTCVEIQPKLAVKLRESFSLTAVHEANFLALKLGKFDRVVMNPPFSKQQDIDHVLHAFAALKCGGKLVSVMSAGVLFRTDKKTAAFRELIAKHGGRISRLPDGSFKSSGTMARTALLEVAYHG